MESDLILILCHEIVDRVNDVFWHGSSSSIVARNVTGGEEEEEEGEEEEAALFSDRGETRDMKCGERKSDPLSKREK